MNRFNICIWGNKLTDTNRNLFDDPKQKSLEIAIVPNIQNVETQSYCSINSSQILNNLIFNKLNTIFSFQAAKESNAFPCHVSPRCHAKVMFFILHKCIFSSYKSVFPISLCTMWSIDILGAFKKPLEIGILILGQRHHWGHIIIFWWIYSCIVFIIYDCALCGTK